MNQKELIEFISIDAGVTKIEVRKTLDSMAKAAARVLRRNGTFKINNIGTLRVVYARAHNARNPRTNLPIRVPARRRVRMTAAKMILAAVN